ncbi:hypothetical protein HDV01_007121 [Terramyces sp. JEL0728]|nr:hypothetical protein HDV01_007121 [Terramyces sp. JEL0728]
MQEKELILKRGYVTLRGLMDSTKQISLCKAKTLEDMQLLFEQLFVIDKYKPIHTRTLPWLGHIAKAAADETPFLVLFSHQQLFEEAPIFIHFNRATIIRDEVYLQKACSIEIQAGVKSYLFTCQTSIEYQEWIQQLHYINQLVKEKNQIHLEGWMRDLPAIDNKFITHEELGVQPKKTSIHVVEKPKLPADFETFILYHESQRSPTIDVSF